MVLDNWLLRARTGKPDHRQACLCKREGRWNAVKRVMIVCLATLMLLVPVLAGCKSKASETKSPEASADQQKLGKNLMKQLPSAPKGQ